MSGIRYDADAGRWEPNVLTISEACRELRISRRFGYKLARENRFPVTIIRTAGRMKVGTSAVMELAGDRRTA